MICPHCRVHYHDVNPSFAYLGKDPSGHWATITRFCPACSCMNVDLVAGGNVSMTQGRRVVQITALHTSVQVYPRGSGRPPAPQEVPAEIASEYTEACTVLPDSPKASAALSRRSLQHVLRDAGGVKPGDLANEIQQVLDSKTLPTALAESVDAIRNIGNFSAHPMKTTSTGQVLPVEPHEAEWNLDVLEALFDFYYVQPSVITKKRAALNKKLRGAGKPPMK